MANLMASVTRRYWAGEIDAFQADEILKTEFNLPEDFRRKAISALEYGLKIGYRGHTDEYRRTFSSLAHQGIIPKTEGERVAPPDDLKGGYKHIWML